MHDDLIDKFIDSIRFACAIVSLFPTWRTSLIITTVDVLLHRHHQWSIQLTRNEEKNNNIDNT